MRNRSCLKRAWPRRGWKHHGGGDSTVAVSVRSHRRINHDWFPCSGLLSGAPRWADGGSVWTGEAAEVSVAVRLCAVNLCSSLLYLSPSGQCRPQSHVHSWPLLLCWLMLGATFTAATADNQNGLLWFLQWEARWPKPNHNLMFPNLRSSTKKTNTLCQKEQMMKYCVNCVLSFREQTKYNATCKAGSVEPTLASWALTQLVKVFFWICSCSTVEAERDINK